ncbi:hypothetical protein BU14_2901s0001, partial [Porphyra umbilicalis]
MPTRCVFSPLAIRRWAGGGRQRLSDQYWSRRALEAAAPAAATRAGWLAARDAAAPAFPPPSGLPPPLGGRPPRPATDGRVVASAAAGATFPLDPARVHVVAHVRRGDFLLNISAVSHRAVFTDAQYAAALRGVVAAIAAEEEGCNGTAHAPGYWASLLGDGWDAATVVADDPAAGDGNGDGGGAVRPPPTGGAPPRRLDVAVAEHISSPTLPSVATMLAADVLLASASAMSSGLGTTSGRGVLLVPNTPPRGMPGAVGWGPSARRG